MQTTATNMKLALDRAEREAREAAESVRLAKARSAEHEVRSNRQLSAGAAVAAPRSSGGFGGGASYARLHDEEAGGGGDLDPGCCRAPPPKPEGPREAESGAACGGMPTPEAAGGEDSPVVVARGEVFDPLGAFSIARSSRAGSLRADKSTVHWIPMFDIRSSAPRMCCRAAPKTKLAHYYGPGMDLSQLGGEHPVHPSHTRCRCPLVHAVSCYRAAPNTTLKTPNSQTSFTRWWPLAQHKLEGTLAYSASGGVSNPGPHRNGRASIRLPLALHRPEARHLYL